MKEETPQSFQMEITPSERRLILELREEQKELQERKAMGLHLLTIAVQYEEWLQKHGRGSSFTTFLDEFGYETQNSCQPSLIYKQVQYLREAAVSGTY